MRQFRTSRKLFADEETHTSLPSIESTDKIPLPFESMSGFIADMNFLIRRGNALVTFPYQGNDYRVKRLARYDAYYYIVFYEDFLGKEQQVFCLNRKSFQVWFQ